MADGMTTHEKVLMPLKRRDLSRGLRFSWKRTLPMILQAEAAECGLACVAMVASYHGHDIDTMTLRAHFPLSLKGASLTRIMAIAAKLGFEGRPLRLDLPQLGKLRRPCLLHWDMNHFVVLSKVDARGVVIHDPARGICRLSLEEASEHFTGVALELTPTTEFRPVKARQPISLRALAGSVRGVVPTAVQVFILALALEVFTLAGPFYLQWTMDQVLVSADRDLLTLLSVGFAAVVLMQTAITAMRSWLIVWMGATTMMQWASNIAGHLLRLPLNWFEKRHVGDVVSRLGSIQVIQNTFTTKFIASLLDGLMSLVIFVVMCFYSVHLAAFVVALFGMYAALRWAFFMPLWRANEDQIVHVARQQSELLESIRGILPIKLANQQDSRRARYANAMVQVINRDVRIQQLNISFGATNQLLFGVGRVALLWVAAVLVLKESFSVGMMIAFTAFADQFIARTTALTDKWVDFRMLKLHAERLADITLSRPEEDGDDDEAWESDLPNASIELRDVSFRYGEDEPWILKNCNLRVESGRSIAITGGSGCGKTTLAKVILGLLEPTEGEVLFGGVPIRKLGVHRYRSLISAVMQDDQLFSGTIAHNISFGAPIEGVERVVEAARLAAVHDDIAAMPMGYNSLVGDMGSSLSGGQKQRVILARALFRQPRLLVLDEATSHLDVEREKLVNGAISQLCVTRIVIAHRLETVMSAGARFDMSMPEGSACRA
ncbi:MULTISPECIES: peptidase domain-containing ABC transporter [Stenotrophomonas]|jgi:ATP-binding cassette, subfamily B, bacterial CvaB/MchF/RaxB|uniref:Peptidase domain-containing ABC transporter n=2 Tax=Stenotrophomonas pavanii TaxID=487698 RepID=A0ABN6GLJ8_9GAMM|nr:MULTISPECIES: peptidase domain-containing ABC transporter [Stenotrophomonas]UGB19296.1 peptidase domain-containing ABC transporter [Stenotrophomonas maltophilia]MCW8342671.1 peptidase domain-containing ABC transporter [Stenotrophomonas sp. SG1]MDQ7273678.1 peptidase domain-containing ABC transporter [Stenotrophomonas sp. Sm3212]UGB50217.1 peptidase domain-containing ABC transporter [Stenotrophomonas maltophilia]BCX41981.1 peptidase domain-containing ABC transporter [Stenotrophomonas pavanii